MTDNFAFTEGSGKTGAADDIGGVLHPRVKIEHGADGSATDVSTASPLPAQLRDSDGTDVALSAKLGSLTETAPATDTASSGLNGRLQRIAQRLTSLIALIPAALTGSGNFKVSIQEVNGSATALPVSAVQGSLPWTVDTPAANLDAKLGSLTETAPASDTASSGLNGRLQRIAQRLTSMIALLPTALGANGGLKIEGVASGTAVPVSIASVPSHAVTNAGTFAVQNNAATPAGTNLIGIVSSSADTSTVYNGTTALTPKFAAITASTSGNNTIVAAVNPKKIRVLAVQLIANAAVNAKWQSGASGTDLTGLAYLAANGGYVLPYNPVGWFETGSNTLLNLNLSGAVAVGGSVVYIEV
jgi:hypothetical protein